MAWFLLFLAGLLEVAWATGLKYTEGFSRPLPSLLTVLAMVGSFWLLALALRSLPLGTAYAVWVGIGAVGTVLCGVLFFAEALTALRTISVLLILAGVVGLKLATPG